MSEQLDTTDAGADVVDPVVIQGADDGGAQDAPQLTEIEELAVEAGWKPPTDWKGDTTEYLSAKDYLKEQAIKSRSRSVENRKLEQRMEKLAKTTDKLLEKALAEQKAELDAQYQDAVAANNPAQARKLAREIDSLDKQASEDPAAEFTAKNPWFGVHEDASDEAFLICQKLARRGKSKEEQLEAAEAGVRAKFPELFGGKPAIERRPAPVVGAPTTRTSTAKPKTFDNLPPEAKAACLSFEKKGLKRDAYVRQYYEENA